MASQATSSNHFLTRTAKQTAKKDISLRDRFMNSNFLKAFIKKYQTLPCLWQVSHPQYQLKNTRLEALKKLTDMCQKIDPSVNELFVMNKIRNLRTVFRKEYNKVIKTAKNGKKYQPKLWYYDLLMFTVLDNDKKVEAQANLEDETLNDTQSFSIQMKAELEEAEQGQEPSPKRPRNVKNIYVINAEKLSANNINANIQPQNNNVEPAPTVPITNINRSQDNNFVNESTCSVNCNFNNPEPVPEISLRSKQAIHDEFDAFGLSMAHHLRCMPFLEAMQMETDIMMIVTQRRAEIYRRNTN